jgi:tetratricopeptide (TPR) repeat protein
MRVLQDGVDRVMSSPVVDVMPCQLTGWDYESPSFKRRITRFEENMTLIVERARQQSVKLIVATLPSNLSDWPPVYKGLAGRDRRYVETVSGIQDLLREGHNREASDAVADGFRLYPDDAMLYFLRGRSQWLTGNYGDARQSFIKARDQDPLPWRATTQINSVIRKVASNVDGVYLVDLEKIFEEHSQNGLVGFDLISDNGHSTPLGESLTAQTIIQTMVEIGYFPHSAQVQGHCCPVDTFLTEVGYFEPKSSLRLRALLDTATFAMKTPFLNFEASRKYLLEALKVDEDSWEVWANLATLSYFAGDPATGAKELQRATELHHAALDFNDRNETPYLKEALEYSPLRADTCSAVLQGRGSSVRASDRPAVARNGHEI